MACVRGPAVSEAPFDELAMRVSIRGTAVHLGVDPTDMLTAWRAATYRIQSEDRGVPRLTRAQAQRRAHHEVTAAFREAARLGKPHP